MTSSLMTDFLAAVAKGPHDLQRMQAARNVDRLAEIRDTIRSLQAAEKELADQLKLTGFEHIEGRIARATIVASAVSKTDWKALAASFNPSDDLIRQFTAGSVVYSVRTYPILRS